MSSLLQESEGLTLGRILDNVPRDAASIFVYVLVAVCIVAVWLGSRPRKRSAEKSPH